MTLHCEVAAASDALKAAIEASVREITKLRGEIAFRKPGGLPNDGKVIEDAKKYERGSAGISAGRGAPQRGRFVPICRFTPRERPRIIPLPAASRTAHIATHVIDQTP